MNWIKSLYLPELSKSHFYYLDESMHTAYGGKWRFDLKEEKFCHVAVHFQVISIF
ncbi:hypothetical protein ACFL1Z_06195 [Thermodesulfobacteriota bacterium]